MQYYNIRISKLSQHSSMHRSMITIPTRIILKRIVSDKSISHIESRVLRQQLSLKDYRRE